MDLAIFKALKGSRITADAVYDALVDAVESGTAEPGQKLPPTRDIALYLEVSRTTVLKAFDKLIARGWVTASRGAGTWIRSEPRNGEVKPDKPCLTPYNWDDRYNDFARTLSLQGSESIESTDFDEINFGASPSDLVPLRAWRKIAVRLSGSGSDTRFDTNGEVFGYRPLREAIAAFVRRTKSIECHPEQIVLQSGVQSVISPSLMLLVKPGDLAVCENPGFWGAREQFHSLGADVMTVPVDANGLIVDALAAIERPVQWLYVAPSCQEPTGATLSLERRHELIAWQSRQGSAILEDDWDSEFHYSGRSAPALFSLDQTGSVIYFYSFWRLLYPLISVGFLIIPRQLIEVFQSYKTIWDRQFTLLEHRVLTELLNEGHVEAHIRAMWKNYRKRRQALIYCLSKHFRSRLTVVPSNTGMHIVVRFDKVWSPEQIQTSAIKAGLSCASTIPYYVHSAIDNEFMIRFSNTPEEFVESQVRVFANELGVLAP